MRHKHENDALFWPMRVSYRRVEEASSYRTLATQEPQQGPVYPAATTLTTPYDFRFSDRKIRGKWGAGPRISRIDGRMLIMHDGRPIHVSQGKRVIDKYIVGLEVREHVLLCTQGCPPWAKFALRFRLKSHVVVGQLWYNRRL